MLVCWFYFVLCIGVFLLIVCFFVVCLLLLLLIRLVNLCRVWRVKFIYWIILF